MEKPVNINKLLQSSSMFLKYMAIRYSTIVFVMKVNPKGEK